ncbi:PfkB family carbohydrate kinase, partial [Escherichia coli]|nr:PfkB family carbohydrate kinase [Escherichia coli]
MDNLDVICIGAAIVDIPLQPVSKNIFDVDSYPLERIAMTTGGDAINEATIISRLGHRTALMGNDSNLLIVFYVQIMPDDFVMQL